MRTFNDMLDEQVQVPEFKKEYINTAQTLKEELDKGFQSGEQCGWLSEDDLDEHLDNKRTKMREEYDINTLKPQRNPYTEERKSECDMYRDIDTSEQQIKKRRVKDARMELSSLKKKTSDVINDEQGNPLKTTVF